MRPTLLLPLLVIAACAPSGGERAILAIGDSIMSWNGDRGIPEVAAASLGRPVSDKSRGGAHVTHPSRVAGALGFDVSRQYAGGSWDWVVLTGGGNDLRGDCATPRAAGTRDGLIGPGLDGDIPALLARIRASGSRVAFIGYYHDATASPSGFAPCQPEFDIINARLTELAADDPGLLFVDAGDAIDPDDRSLYARDLIHPSRRGSEAIGRALADAIRAAEGA